MKYLHGYAAWTRRQASTANCGHAVAGGAAAVAIAALALWWFIATYLTVIEQVCCAVLGVTAVAVLTWGILAAGEARHRRWLRAACEDCRTAAAIAQVTYANGTRSGTVRTCGPCWKRAEAAATAADGRSPGWDWDRSGPGLPRVAEEPVPAPELRTDHIAPELSRPEPFVPQAATWEELEQRMDPAAEAAAIRGTLTAAPDNEPAEDEHTAAELARVLEQAAPAIVPPSQWTRSHP
jgi:hypothetical protein